MIEAAPTATASLSSMLVRRSPQLRLVPPAAFGRAIRVEPPARPEWVSDLRFFLTCYAAGFVFFLIMLS